MDAKLFHVLSNAVEELGLEWSPPEEPSRSHLDEWFLPGRLDNKLRKSSPRFTTRSSLGVHPTRPAYVPLRPPPSLRPTAQKKKFTTACLHWMSQWHLCPPTAIGWKAKSTHPSKLCRTASALAERAYSSAVQAALALHSMVVLFNRRV